MKLSWLAIGNALLYVWFCMQLLCVSFSFSLLLFAMVGSLLCELLSSGNGMPSQFAIIEPNRRHIFVCSVAVAAAIFFCYSSILCESRTLSAYHIYRSHLATHRETKAWLLLLVAWWARFQIQCHHFIFISIVHIRSSDDSIRIGYYLIGAHLAESDFQEHIVFRTR